MKYYIRDDDTSYFTSRKELDDAYHDIWVHGPVNLAVIPYVVRTENHGILGRYKQFPDKEFFIGDNIDLVNYLKQLITQNKVNIMLHGYNHYYMPANEPLYPFGVPEFIHTKNQFDKIAKGKKDLEELFGVKIKWFIPPSNALNNETIQACEKLSLNIPLVLDLKKRRISTLFKNPLNLIINRFNMYSGFNLPLNFSNHKEILCTSYTSATDFSLVNTKKNMIVATHYWEVNSYSHIKNQMLNDISFFGNKIFSMNDI